MIDSLHKYPLFPDLLENQKQSVQFFWEKGILEELELFSYLSRSNASRGHTIVSPVHQTENTGNTAFTKKNMGSGRFETHAGNIENLVSPLGLKTKWLRFPKKMKLYPVEPQLWSNIAGPKSFPVEQVRWRLNSSSVSRVGGSFEKSLFVFKPLVQTFFSFLVPWSLSGDSTKQRNLSKERLKQKYSALKVLETPAKVQKDIKKRLKTDTPSFFDKMAGVGFRRGSMERGSSGFESAGRLEQSSSASKMTPFFAGSANAVFSKRSFEKTSSDRSAEKPKEFHSSGETLPINSKVDIGSGKQGDGSRSVAHVSGEKVSSVVIHGSKFFLKAPFYSQEDAIRFQKTYSVGLYIPIEFLEVFPVCEANRVQQSSFPVRSFPWGSRPPDANPREAGGKNFVLRRPKDASGFALSRFDAGVSKQALTPTPRVRGEEDHSSGSFPSPGAAVGSTGFGSTWFYFGDIPLMTERGSFLINGAPRVLVNQIVRCPSVYFKLKLDPKNRRTYIASFISEYGSWLRLETDRLRSRIWVRIDKSPRFPLDILVSALGWSSDSHSNDVVNCVTASNIKKLRFEKTHELGGKNTSGKRGFSKNSEQINEATQLIWKKCNASRWTSLSGCYSFFYTKFFHPRRYSLGNVGRLRLNKRLGRNGECKIPTLTPEDIFLALEYLIHLQNGNKSSFYHLDDIDHLKNRRVRLPGEILQNQFRLALSRVTSIVQNALTKTRDLPTGMTWRTPRAELAGVPVHSDSKGLFSGLPHPFVPRTGGQLRQKGLDEEEQNTFPDSVEPNPVEPPGAAFSGRTYVFPAAPGIPAVGSTGFGLIGFERANRGSRPIDLLRGRTLAQMFGGSPPQTFVTTLRELFNTSPLSQYMDQTNPLAEITHKRRLSSLGPGGVGRDQAGFAVREIHPSHFGRICPIETPEGQNAGLVGSLASYAQINSNGFLLSPAIEVGEASLGELPLGSKPPAQSGEEQLRRRRAEQTRQKKGYVPVYLFPAEAEDDIYLCTADIGETTKSLRSSKASSVAVPIRYKQEFIPTALKKIQYTGVCPVQMISVATSLIPFLEHDDANRALMGSNMQRQAVPLLFPEKPYVGTGLEIQAARDSSTTLLAPFSGQITYVDSKVIELKGGTMRRSYREPAGKVFGSWSSIPPVSPQFVAVPKHPFDFSEKRQKTTFSLQKYSRSNQSTSMTQRPAVQLGEWVEKGDILADGSATHDGEVSLGKNILLAYMPWEGYNFEDAIVISERLVFDDVYSSLHIERYEIDIRNASPIRLRPHFEESLASSTSFAFSGLDAGVSKFALTPPPPYRTERPGAAEATRSGAGKQIPSGGSLPGSFFQSPAKLDQVQPGKRLSLSSLELGKEYITKDLDIVFAPPSSPETRILPPPVNKSPGEAGGKNLSSVLNPVEPPAVPGIQAHVVRPSPEPVGKGLFQSQICHLDSEGIIMPGTWVKEGDILVGKITPTQKTKISSGQSPPEYRLLVAIFAEEGARGDAALQIRFKNTSFKAGIGVQGRVIDCIVPWRKSAFSSPTAKTSFLRKTPRTELFGVPSPTMSLRSEAAFAGVSKPLNEANRVSQSRKSFPIQIFLAHKKRIQLGDKMSGRHGNKGIVSLILPPQDMPYIQDGTPVDVVLNPLGVPSRMNVGQVLETLLGLVSFALHEMYRLMPFDEMYSKKVDPETVLFSGSLHSVRAETSRSLVYSKLLTVRNRLGPSAAWFFDPNNPGKTQLFDGRTGEVYHQPALVGYSYMFKLIHLVDDKIHARSTGPYSLVTQQPLGGRSKKGGQRLGEMEVWALEGFGAAYILQEFLTVKSDEIYSRNTFLLNLMKRKIPGRPFGPAQLDGSGQFPSGRDCVTSLDSHFRPVSSPSDRTASRPPLAPLRGAGLSPAFLSGGQVDQDLQNQIRLGSISAFDAAELSSPGEAGGSTGFASALKKASKSHSSLGDFFSRLPSSQNGQKTSTSFAGTPRTSSSASAESSFLYDAGQAQLDLRHLGEPPAQPFLVEPKVQQDSEERSSLASHTSSWTKGVAWFGNKTYRRTLGNGVSSTKQTGHGSGEKDVKDQSNGGSGGSNHHGNHGISQKNTESRVPESFRVLVNELQALCLSIYYNPDFRLSYPSLLGWDGVFLRASKKYLTSYELSQIKNIG